MARQRGFVVQCINIRVHTAHIAEEYEALWKAVGRMRIPIVWRTGLALMIGESAKREASPTNGFYGQFYRFVQINKDDPWFDISKHKPAEAEDLARVSIPANLRANLLQTPYFFDVHKHRLYFLSRSGTDTLSANAVHKLLESLFMFPSIVAGFGKVDMTIATQKDEVQKLLEWPVVRRLTIQLERPNPTDYEDEEAVFRHLNGIGAKTETRDYQRADDRPTLRPDDEMKALATVAADNGSVEVTGTDPDGRRRTANSQEYVWSLKRTYDQRHQSLTDAFLQAVGDMFTRRL